VTIVGDLDRDAAKALAEELTSRLSKRADSALAPVATLAAGATLRVAHPSTQSHVLLGVSALSRADPDYFPLFVGNYSLGGGGFMSRLFREIREKRGYAYSAYSYFRPYEREGPFLVGLETRRDQAREALELARSVVGKFVKHGPTEAELKAAKKSLVGGFPLRIDTNRKILEQIAVIGFYRLPLNWLGRELTGMACLDLFAGSGALGFEALSRGAASVVMVEKHPAALRALRENAQKLGAANLTVVRGDALEFARGARARFDVVFVD